MIKLPTGIIKNTNTGKYHPIIFRNYPLPNGLNDNRYKSIGYHPESFITKAITWIWILKHMDRLKYCGRIYEWDGNGIPEIWDIF